MIRLLAFLLLFAFPALAQEVTGDCVAEQQALDVCRAANTNPSGTLVMGACDKEFVALNNCFGAVSPAPSARQPASPRRGPPLPSARQERLGALSQPSCDKPKLYDVYPEFVAENPGFYCWELRYMLDFGVRTIRYGEASLIAGADTELLRSSGITPEKARYLAQHFTDENYKRFFCGGEWMKSKKYKKACDDAGNNIPLEWKRAADASSPKDALDIIMMRATIEMARFRAEYDIDYIPATKEREAGMYAHGRAPFNSWECSSGFRSPAALRVINTIILKLPFVEWTTRKAFWVSEWTDGTPKEEIEANIDREIKAIKGSIDIAGFNDFPDYLAPVGVIGKYFVNAFGEVVGYINDDKKNSIRLLDDRNVGYWYNNPGCYITDFKDMMRYTPLHDKIGKIRGKVGNALAKANPFIKKQVSDEYPCTSCRMFELAFNTISRIALAFYDDISSYGLIFLAGIFALWALWQFFTIVIRKQKSGEEFIKSYWTRFAWLFLLAGLMSVLITDQFNIFRYTLGPVTSLMSGFVEKTTGILDAASGYGEQGCRYRQLTVPSEENDSMLFPPEIRGNIVCTIERLADYNHFNIVIGRLSMASGWRQISWGEWGSGLTKIFIGLSIVILFFFLNLAVPFYFIESIFKMGIVVLLLPLLLGAYAFEKTKGLVMEAWHMFFAAVMQIVFISIMCMVIILLFMYVMGADLHNIYGAFAAGNAQEATSHIIYMLSFSPASLLESFYTGVLAWYMIGKAVDYANEFGSGNSAKDMANKFINWQQNAVKYFVSVVADKALYINTGKALENRARRENAEIGG